MSAGVSSPNFLSPAPWQQQVLAQLDLDGEPPNLKRYDLNILKPSSTGTSLGIAKSSCFLHCYCSGAKIMDDESIETRQCVVKMILIKEVSINRKLGRQKPDT
ncbi:uncharacterized protein LOC105794362 [Gossypium raimondii]|uniref:uncharacterized protein LOC105794362 n=1 Tax=Gossypium raimondii TaxID=29730 RepID=UPI00063ACAED|nr:uncharacterized protein LOC105794362 [Gossypium raimondii]XP_012478967.1 uncharacterized protein LOC105794362 [Gossypium raimondii]